VDIAPFIKIKSVVHFITGVAVLPTTAQTLACFDVCQRLTNLFLPIFIVRLDRRIRQIFILAREDFQVLIDRDGKVDYL
jgi:hypothetical protein